MIKIIELDEIAEENPGNYIGKKNKMTNQTSVVQNKTGNWQNSHWFSFLGLKKNNNYIPLAKEHYLGR